MKPRSELCLSANVDLAVVAAIWETGFIVTTCVPACYPGKNQCENSFFILLYAPQWRLNQWIIAPLKPDCSNSGFSVFESISSHSVSAFIHQWFYSPLLGPGCFFQFRDPVHCRWDSLDGVISPSQGRYLHSEQHKHRINAHRHPYLEWDSNPQPQCLSGRR
jgi:hypothetical protein